MRTSTKIISATVTILAIGGIVVFALNRRKKNQEEKEALLKEIEDQKKLTKEQLAQQQQAVTETVTQQVLTDIGDNKVGKIAYPKGSYVNVRSSPKVNNGLINNFIYEKYKKKVGLILEVVNSTEYGDRKKWYKVRLTEPFDGWTFDYTEGYVREDQVTVKNI